MHYYVYGPDTQQPVSHSGHEIHHVVAAENNDQRVYNQPARKVTTVGITREQIKEQYPELFEALSVHPAEWTYYETTDAANLALAMDEPMEEVVMDDEVSEASSGLTVLLTEEEYAAQRAKLEGLTAKGLVLEAVMSQKLTERYMISALLEMRQMFQRLLDGHNDVDTRTIELVRAKDRSVSALERVVDALGDTTAIVGDGTKANKQLAEGVQRLVSGMEEVHSRLDVLHGKQRHFAETAEELREAVSQPSPQPPSLFPVICTLIVCTAAIIGAVIYYQ